MEWPVHTGAEARQGHGRWPGAGASHPAGVPSPQASELLSAVRTSPPIPATPGCPGLAARARVEPHGPPPSCPSMVPDGAAW